MSSRENADYLMARAQQAGITDNEELANFMGQMQIESGGYVRMSENLNYSGGRLLQVFNGRNGMNTREEADVIAAGGPEAVANTVYGGDWGRRYLGNTEPNDGWRFHGRGYVQLTGRDNYERIGNAIGVDLVSNPDLAEDREIASRIAVHYWESRVVPNNNERDIPGATQNINGGFTHVAERTAAANEWKTKLDQRYRPEAVLDNQQMDPLQSIQNEAMRMQLGAASAAMIDGLPDYLRKPGARARDELADGMLRQGETGPAVHGLQERLADAGIAEGRGRAITADSSFGRSTREAVENAQLWSGLPVTGAADKDTINAIVDPMRRAGTAARSEDAADLNQHDELRPRTATAPQTPDPGPPAMANPVQSQGPRDSRDPRDPTHPDHALYEQIRSGVEKLDAQHGRGFDVTSERMSLSLLTLAKETGITRVDEVVVNKQTSTLPAGATVFLVQGDRSNEAMHRESMPTAVTTQTPPEKSMQQLEVVNQQIVQQQQAALARGQDDPSRGGPSMGGR